MALMVIDIQKGIQTQTAEGLVIAQITVDEMVVVINKIDTIPDDAREQKIQRCLAVLKKAFSNTRFANSMMIPYSAKVPNLFLRSNNYKDRNRQRCLNCGHGGLCEAHS